MYSRGRVWDPLYGRIDFTEFELSLISLPEIQRLRYVRMCNINSLLVTGASEISRYEHTVGVLRLAQEWNKNKNISDTSKQDLLAAAVLHDMKTGPFGHSMQYVFEDNAMADDFRHDDLHHHRKTYHQDVTAKTGFSGKPFGAESLLGNRWLSVSEMIKGNGELGPIISGTMDIDNIDNVIRLAYHVGVATQEDGAIALRLARDMAVTADGDLQFSASSIVDIRQWQAIRRKLYNLLLLDWAEFSAKAMLTRAVELAVHFKRVEADVWIQTDLEFLAYLEKECIGEAQEASELIKRLRVGELYEPATLLRSRDIEKYTILSEFSKKQALEKELAALIKEKYHVNIRPIIHFILDKGKTDRSIEVRIKENNEIIRIGESSRDLLVGVFVSRGGLSENVLEGISSEAKRILAAEGICDVSPLTDPMGSPVSSDEMAPQLRLI